MKKITLILLFLGFIFGCNKTEKGVNGRWFFASVTDVEAKQVLDSKDVFIDLKSVKLKPVSDYFEGAFLNLMSDGNYNLRFYELYEEGTWQFEKEKKTVQLKAKEVSKIKLVSFNNDVLTIQFGKISDDTTLILTHLSDKAMFKFTRDSVSYNDEVETPFSFKYNKWALHETKKLSDKQIREKLINLIDFMLLVLKDPRNNSKFIENLPVPIKLGKNGIGLKAKNKIPKAWNNLFVDEANADRCYQILRYAFGFKMTIKDTNSFVELSTDLLTQLRSIINGMKD